MEVTLITDRAAKESLLQCIWRCDHIDVAVAWAGKNELLDALIANDRKLRHVIVGTHMYQTPPDVLRKLMRLPQARYMPPDGPLFHPKIYLFQIGSRVFALVGSHNLTASAFDGGNIEASVLIEGDDKTQPLRSLVGYVKKAWERGKVIDEEGFLFAYEKQYEANKSKRKDLSTFHHLATPRTGTRKPSPMVVTWPEFERQVRADKHHSVEDRLRVLERAAILFQTTPSFRAMKHDERRAIAGTYGRKEKGIDGLPWAWFGTMFGQGDFKHLINNEPDTLSAALDEIPLEGNVEKEAYDRFTKLFQKAFKKKSHVGGVATASRLLMMKRPDLFVGVNDANRRGLCDAIGVAYSTLTLSNYWERIVVPIQVSPWWRNKPPRQLEARRIWHNRAALLDCIYYDPTTKKSATKE